MGWILGDHESLPIQFYHAEGAGKFSVDSQDTQNVGLKLENLSRRRSRPYKKQLTALLAGFASVTVYIFYIYLCGATLGGKWTQLKVHGRNLAGDETTSSPSVKSCDTGDEPSPLAPGGLSSTAPQTPFSEPRAKKRRKEGRERSDVPLVPPMPPQAFLEAGAAGEWSASEPSALSHRPLSSPSAEASEVRSPVITSEEFAAATALLMLGRSTAKIRPQGIPAPETVAHPGAISATDLPSASANKGSSTTPHGSQPHPQPRHEQQELWKLREGPCRVCTTAAATTTTSDEADLGHSASSADAEGTSDSVVELADLPSPAAFVDVHSTEQKHRTGSPVASATQASQLVVGDSTLDGDESSSTSGSPSGTALAPELPGTVPACSSQASTSSAFLRGPCSASAPFEQSGSSLSPSGGLTISALPLVSIGDAQARQHPYYRLPRVDPSHQALRRFSPVLATSRSVARREIFVPLQMMRELLLKDSLTSEELDEVCKLTQLLAAHANFFENNSTRMKPRYVAVPILARRFLVLDYLLCGLQLLGVVAEGAWWNSVSSAVNSEDSLPRQSTVRTEQADFNRDLSRHLCAALNVLKTGRRVSEGDTILLKQMLFRSHLSPLAFWGPQWNAWREDDKNYSGS
ncbi:hypothetical protein Esti_004581 [Eimeria stiedai]